MLVWPDIQAVIANERPTITRLSPDSRVLLQTALSSIQGRYNYTQDAVPGVPVTDAQWDEIDRALSNAAGELMSNPLIGVPFPFITASPPLGALECDGSTYARTDYPELYAVLDPAFIVDANTFRVPDLRGRVAIGVGTLGSDTYAQGDVGGEARHTLAVTEMPSHAHTDAGHTHTTGNSLPGLALAPGEEPVLVPNPIPGVTGIGNAAIQPTGGGGAHENRPPYLALRWGVWAW